MYGRTMIRGALAVFVAALFVAVALPVLSKTAYADDFNAVITRLSPSESMEVETGGGETPWVALKSTPLGYDTGHIENLIPSESIIPEEAVGGGETSRMELKPTKFGNNAGNIERLLPSEDPSRLSE
jgi:hypothetical protein